MAIHHQALFEPAVSVDKVPWHMKMSYKGVYRAVNSIWMSILSHPEYADLLLDGEIELGEAYFALRRRGNHGREGGGRGPVFGILERDGLVHVHVVPNVPAKLCCISVKRPAGPVSSIRTSSGAMIAPCSADIAL